MQGKSFVIMSLTSIVAFMTWRVAPKGIGFP
jgi:hypothetical protein